MTNKSTPEQYISLVVKELERAEQCTDESDTSILELAKKHVDDFLAVETILPRKQTG